MQAKLIVKKFGPIIDVNLDLRNVNVFIGPQASGKSSLAKLYTICKSPLNFLNKAYSPFGDNPSPVEDINRMDLINFRKTLEDYNIQGFLNVDSYIEFESDLHHIIYQNDSIVYNRKLLFKILKLEEELKADVFDANKMNGLIIELCNKLFHFRYFLRNFLDSGRPFSLETIEKDLSSATLSVEQYLELIDNAKRFENDISSNAALYIPAERNLIGIIKGASLSLQNSNIPIPKHILSFGAEYESATFNVQELALDFIKEGLKYVNKGGLDFITEDGLTELRLTESASGIQSVIPLILPIESRKRKNIIKHLSFVIEEAELNLFPKGQYELIKFLEKGRTETLLDVEDLGTIHTYTTHSPYILSAFNNFLYAGKIFEAKSQRHYRKYKKVNYESTGWYKEIMQIVPALLKGRFFSAFQISNGTATSIFNRELSLIDDNFIDQSSDIMAEDFEALMELMNSDDPDNN